MGKLLEVKGLKTHFFTQSGVVKAVDGINYHVDEGEVLGIVGESGCGKSVGAMSIMKLVARPTGRIVDGEIMFEGDNLLDLDDAAMRHVRGNRIAMVFQEPMTSLNPVLTIGRQLTETLELHQGMTRDEADVRAGELLSMVGIPDPESRLKDYPHQFSGGMRQRVMIAMALSCSPRLIIADEPTTALDVTIQAQILELMQDLAKELGTALIIITHNLGVVARYADRVIVMYAGKIIESASAADLYANPKHPYTRALLNSVPRLDESREGIKLEAIQGMPRDLSSLTGGCSFAPRCRFVQDSCLTDDPVLEDVAPAHQSACLRNAEIDQLAAAVADTSGKSE